MVTGPVAPVAGLAAYVIDRVLADDRRLGELLAHLEVTGAITAGDVEEVRQTLGVVRAMGVAYVASRRRISLDGNAAERGISVERSVLGGRQDLLSASQQVTTTEAGRMLNLGSARVGQLLRAGVLRGRRNGRTWLVDVTSVDAYRAGGAA